MKVYFAILLTALSLGCSAVSFNQVARPSGSLGPYYPPSPAGLPFYAASPWSEVASDDLTQRHGTRAAGASLEVRVLVVDAQGAPVVGATVELWNVNASARYICEPGASDDDPGFVGFGRLTTASDGRASFRTVWPVSYSRYVLLRRPPHLHLRVRSSGRDDAYEVEVPPTQQNVLGGDIITLTLAP